VDADADEYAKSESKLRGPLRMIVHGHDYVVEYFDDRPLMRRLRAKVARSVRAGVPRRSPAKPSRTARRARRG